MLAETEKTAVEWSPVVNTFTKPVEFSSELVAEQTTAAPGTHDVDEALLLADRIVVLSQGPQARIKADIEVPFDRPRDRDEILSSSEYPALHRKLLGLLREEIAA